MALLSKAQILGAPLRTRDVDVPEWGGTVRVIEMTAADREGIEIMIAEAREEGGLAKANVRAHYAAACIVGDDGKPQFTEKDIAALGKLSGAALQRVQEAITALNQLAPDDIKAAAKNS